MDVNELDPNNEGLHHASGNMLIGHYLLLGRLNPGFLGLKLHEGCCGLLRNLTSIIKLTFVLRFIML